MLIAECPRNVVIQKPHNTLTLVSFGGASLIPQPMAVVDY
jgi:hypothetical protein